MSKPVFSVDAVLEWARSKDPKEEFCPLSGLTCALAQYGMHIGIPFACGGVNSVHEMNDTNQNYMIKSYEIRNMPANAIFRGAYVNSKGRGVNNFGNLVKALEQHITASPTF